MQYFPQDLFASFIHRGQSLIIKAKEDWQSFAMLAANGLLVLLIVVGVVSQAYQIYQIVVVNPAADKTLNKKKTLTAQSKGISQWHLFGVPPPPVAVTKTKVNWKVSGIILGKTPADNLAIIGTNATDQTTVKTGDKLSDGAVVEKILPDQVVLNQEDNEEKTLLISWESAAAPEGAPAAAPQAALAPAEDYPKTENAKPAEEKIPDENLPPAENVPLPAVNDKEPL